MSKPTTEILLEEISRWNTDDVVALLQKNNLAECCNAIVKRHVDGEKLLHLTEASLNLWKNDLTSTLRRSLCRFLEELKLNPVQYCGEIIEQYSPPNTDSDFLGDSDNWDTDFEDDDPSSSDLCQLPHSIDKDSCYFSESSDYPEMYSNSNPPPIMRRNPTGIEESIHVANGHTQSPNRRIYNNKTEIGKKITSLDHSTRNNISITTNIPDESQSLAAQLTERLRLMNLKKTEKLAPKLEIPINKPGIESLRKTSSVQKVAQLNKSKISLLNPELLKPMESIRLKPPDNALRNPPNPKNGIQNLPSKGRRDLPQPPTVLANLSSANIDDSDDGSDCEFSFHRPVPQCHNNVETKAKACSKQPLRNLRLLPSLSHINYEPPAVNDENNDNDRTYESILGSLEVDKPHVKPIRSTSSLPSQDRHLYPSHNQPRNFRERSPNDKGHTFPLRSDESPSVSRTSRPLPATPNVQESETATRLPERNIDGPTYMDKPWFHNVTRDQAIALVNGGSDGYFLLRPTSTRGNVLTLVVCCRNKVYNVRVRRRPDLRYALGSVKLKEKSFATIEEIVHFYTREELVLYSQGEEPTMTRLIESPPKRNTDWTV